MSQFDKVGKTSNAEELTRRIETASLVRWHDISTDNGQSLIDKQGLGALGQTLMTDMDHHKISVTTSLEY